MDLDQIIQDLKALQAATFTQFAAATLVTYDLLLNLRLEVILVWKGTWGLPAIIYFLNRYGIFLQSSSLTCISILLLLERNTSSGLCQGFNVLSTWSIPLTFLIIEAMLILRVIALYHNSKRMAALLWGLYVFSMAVSLILVSIEVAEVLPRVNFDGGSGCYFIGTRFYWAVWVPSLVMETTLIILTVIRSMQHRLNGVHTPLLTVLVRDGIIYFVVVFCLMLSNLIVSITASPFQYGIIVELTLCIASVLCSWLFLDLRKVAYSGRLATSKPSPDGNYGLQPVQRGLTPQEESDETLEMHSLSCTESRFREGETDTDDVRLQ